MNFFSKYYFLTIFSLFTFSISATNYYCDPVNGNMNNNGTTEASAWSSLKDLFGSSKRNLLVEGDIVYLMNGAHGRSYIAKSNTGYVSIKALEGHTPKLAGIQFGTASFWSFDGLIFTADGSGGEFRTNFMNSKATTTHLKVTNCTFYMEEDSSSWTFDDWYEKTQKRSYHGLRIIGDFFTFNNNTIKNVYFGLLTEGSNIEIKNNIIENFGADAIQMQNCSNVLIENNIIRNAYLENYGGNIGGHPSNHDDAIQLLGLTSNLDNVVISKNKIYNFIDPITQDMIDNNLVGYQMQGIFLTDGHIINSLIENNLIVIDTYHGLTLNSSVNARIQNNTVVRTPNPLNSQIARPWIMQYTGKGGTHTGGVVRNNIAQQYSTVGGNTIENNLTVSSSSVDDFFSDYSNFDFTLFESSLAVEAGVNTDLSDTDLVGNNRLFGTNVDCGAYEFDSSLGYEYIIDNNFSVYPTVVGNYLTIEVNEELVGNKLSLRVTSLDGRIIEQNTLMSNNKIFKYKYKFLHNETSGIYLLSIIQGNSSKIVKLIKR